MKTDKIKPMESARTLKTIVRNMVQLTANQQFEDLETFRTACSEGLNRYDLAAVKQAFEYQLTNRG